MVLFIQLSHVVDIYISFVDHRERVRESDSPPNHNSTEVYLKDGYTPENLDVYCVEHGQEKVTIQGVSAYFAEHSAWMHTHLLSLLPSGLCMSPFKSTSGVVDRLFFGMSSVMSVVRITLPSVSRC